LLKNFNRNDLFLIINTSWPYITYLFKPIYIVYITFIQYYILNFLLLTSCISIWFATFRVLSSSVPPHISIYPPSIPHSHNRRESLDPLFISHMDLLASAFPHFHSSTHSTYLVVAGFAFRFPFVFPALLPFNDFSCFPFQVDLSFCLLFRPFTTIWTREKVESWAKKLRGVAEIALQVLHLFTVACEFQKGRRGGLLSFEWVPGIPGFPATLVRFSPPFKQTN